ncbi:DUF899 family protein [Brachybacterium paraconglomeratum]
MTDHPHRIPADDAPADGAGAPGPGLPEVVDRETWEAARAELLLEEKAHTRAGDALAAKRRRMPMLEVDGDATVVGADGPVPFRSLFEGRDELLVYQHMWWDGAPHQGQCEGCTMTAWHLHDACYLRAAGVSFAILTTGAWEEVAPFVAFMGYTDVDGNPTWGPTGRPAAQWTRPGATAQTTLGRTGMHH